MKYFFLLFTFCLLLIKLPSAIAEESKLNILATTFPIYLLTQRIVEGQNNIQLSLMLPAHAGCPHDYTLTPNDMRKLVDADVLVINGLGLENFLDTSTLRINPKLKIIDCSSGVEGILRYSVQYPSQQTSQRVSSNNKEEAGYNPHLFASPRMMARMSIALAEKISGLAPDCAEQLKKNALTYAGELNKLADDFTELGKRLKNSHIITQHEVFDYLARDTGLEVIAVLQTHPGQEPSATEIFQLIQIIRANHVSAIFIEPQYPNKIGRTLSLETDIPLAVLDPVATGPENPGLNYYCTTMRNNLLTLEQILGLR